MIYNALVTIELLENGARLEIPYIHHTIFRATDDTLTICTKTGPDKVPRSVLMAFEFPQWPRHTNIPETI